jgi:hypothetical protein
MERKTRMSNARAALWIFLAVVFCAGCTTLRPKALQGGGEGYRYFLSKGIALTYTDTRNETLAYNAIDAGDPIIAIEKDGVLTLHGVMPADYTDTVAIGRLVPGFMRKKDSAGRPMRDGVRVLTAQSRDLSAKFRNDYMIIRVVFDGAGSDDDFLEFAAYYNEKRRGFLEWLESEDKFRDDKFYLLFDVNRQVKFKGQKYRVDFEGNDRPYLTYEKPEKE